MQIPKGKAVAVIVRRDWANLAAVRIFLRQGETPPGKQIGGSDDSHIIFTDVLDADDPKGLWIELNTERHKDDPSVERFPFLVPWAYVLAVVISEKFSPEVYESARKMGFNPKPQRDM
ncbi:MAG: hypothetical protein WBE37_18355 [Bryobacteraceae bacterium]